MPDDGDTFDTDINNTRFNQNKMKAIFECNGKQNNRRPVSLYQ